ncbi:MAG: OmpA family protein, partial [Flavobacteriaceae bacterium]
TTITPTKGLRDLSFNLGYLFSFSKKDPMEPEYRPPFFRLGIGAGFDQINMRTNAVINGFAFPTNYALAQLQGRAGLHLTPFVFYSDKSGKRIPTFSINLHGGAAYNHFTSAIREGNNTSVDLLNDSNTFKQNYLSFHYGGGFQLFLTKTTQLYARYTIDNSEEFVEDSTLGGAQLKETYKLNKNRFSLGLLVNFRLINRIKKQQEDKYQELEKMLAQTNTTLDNLQSASQDFDGLKSTVEEVQMEVDKLKKDFDELNESVLKTGVHKNGIRYFPEFREVLFDRNSSYFDKKQYADLMAKLAIFLNQNPDVKVRFVGYADTTGPESFNTRLSEKRAKRLKDYLVRKHNIASNQIVTVAKGETDKFSTSEYASNRRTEIQIFRN